MKITSSSKLNNELLTFCYYNNSNEIMISYGDDDTKISILDDFSNQYIKTRNGCVMVPSVFSDLVEFRSIRNNNLNKEILGYNCFIMITRNLGSLSMCINQNNNIISYYKDTRFELNFVNEIEIIPNIKLSCGKRFSLCNTFCAVVGFGVGTGCGILFTAAAMGCAGVGATVGGGCIDLAC